MKLDDAWFQHKQTKGGVNEQCTSHTQTIRSRKPLSGTTIIHWNCCHSYTKWQQHKVAATCLWQVLPVLLWESSITIITRRGTCPIRMGHRTGRRTERRRWPWRRISTDPSLGRNQCLPRPWGLQRITCWGTSAGNGQGEVRNGVFRKMSACISWNVSTRIVCEEDYHLWWPKL